MKIKRRVLFKKYTPASLIFDEEKQNTVTVSSHLESDFLTEGIFHQWGNTFIEYESGPGNITVALVETRDGLVHEVHPSHLKFIN